MLGDEMLLWEFGVEDIDLWAVKVAVREGRYMALTRREQTLAIKLMMRKGHSLDAISKILRLSKPLASKLSCKGLLGVDVDALVEALPELVGPPVPTNDPPLSSVDTRRLCGR